MERQIGYGINAESFTISKVRLFGKTILLLPKVCHSGVAWDEVQSTCDASKERSCNTSENGGQEGDNQSTPSFQKDNTNSCLQEELTSYSGSSYECKEANKVAKMFRIANGSAVALETSETKEVIGELQTKGKLRKKPQCSPLQEHIHYQCEKLVPCPRCGSLFTKFCYYNNYNLNEPRHFCKNCQRYWTAGGILRHVPMGAGRGRKRHRSAQQGNSFPGNLSVRAEGALTVHNLLPCDLTYTASSPAATSSITNLNELRVRAVPKLNLNSFEQESDEKGSDGSLEESPTSTLMSYDGRWSIKPQNATQVAPSSGMFCEKV